MSRKIEDRYERLLLPLFDTFERKAVAAFESRARELAAPTVGIDLDWLRTWLDKTIEEVVIKPSHEKQGEIVKTAYRQGITWADTNLSALTVGAKLTPGPIDWRALDVLKARNTSLMTKLGADLNAGIIEGLTEGLMQGESIPHLAKRVQNAVQAIGRVRAVTIARTETMYAVNQGTLIRYSQAGVRRVRWLTGLDERACEECEALHGNEYEIGSEPALPVHPNCVLPGTWAETPGGIVAGLRARYDGEAVKITLANGGYLAVTPNHMLLTPDGFAAAHLLREGDDVLYCPHLERVVPSNPHVDRYPARVEDIIGTLAEAPGMTAARVPVTPEYLHGDGRNADGHIDVIRPDCLLRGASEPVILKHPEAHTLNPGDTRGRSLAAPGDLAAVLERLALAADGGMSGGRESAPLFLRRLGHSQEHGRGTPARGDTGAPEPAVDNAPGNTEPPGERLNRHAGIVEGDDLLGVDPVAALPREAEFAEPPPDNTRARPETIRDLLDRQPLVIQTTKVVRIDRRPFHGYIYDLQTPSTLCIYNNVITSNCRCTVIPVIEVPK